MLSMKRHFGAFLHCWCLCTRKTCTSFLQTYMHFRVDYRAYFFQKSANQPGEEIYIAYGNTCAAFSFKTSQQPNGKLKLNCLEELQYSSQILKHLCSFPIPQCWFVYCSHLSTPKYAWLNIGEGEGHISARTKVPGVNVRNFPENSSETVSVSTICDEYREEKCDVTLPW